MTRPTEPEANETPCERAEPLLSAFLLEEVSGSDREAIASHIATCAHCREELEMLSSAASALRSIPPLEAGLEPADRERILNAARQSAAASRGARSRVIYLAIGGLAAAAVLVALLVPGIVSFDVRKRVEVAHAPEPVKVAMEGRGLDGLEIAARETVAPRTATAPDGKARRVVVEDLAAKGESLGFTEGLGVQSLNKEVATEQKLEQKLTLLALAEKEKLGGLSDAGTESTEAARHEFRFGEAMPQEAKAGSGPVREEEERASRRLRESLSQAEPEQLRRELVTEARKPDAAEVVKKAKKSAYRSALSSGAESSRDAGWVDGVDLARQSIEKVHEFAPGLDPLQFSRGAAAPAAEAPRESPAEPASLATRAGGYGGRALADGAERAPSPPAARPATAAVPTTGAASPPTDKPAETPPTPGAPVPLDSFKKEPADAAAADRLAAATPAAPAAGPTIGPAQAPPAGGATTSPVPPETDWKKRVDDFLSRLDRRPGETPGMMFFRYWGTNPFVEASSDPLSTFAVDVDTASYTLARAYFYDRGMLPPREAIRTEEFINFFKSRYAPPAADGPAFAVHAEMAPSPFAHEADYQLLKVGLKGREVAREKRKACGLVFVIDTSGSMRQGNRLELVKEALRLLVPELDEGDTVGIVAFDREARVILDPVPASEKERILDAISRLEPRQNTNVAAGLEMGYQMAARHKVKDGSNRVLLLSDGVANTGNVDPVAMTEKVRGEREQGIYLTCVGVGMGNMNDSLMETLADRGNGQCVYVDRIEQAKKAFVDNLTGTLEAIAKDAKIQVEFDPAKVIRYRLLGYENRDIADAQFRDNKVDAGEVGAGHEVTALYELKLKPDAGDALATIRVRYLTVDHGEAVEIARPVTAADRRKTLAEASPRFQVSACAAELAEVLRGSYWARGSTLDKVAAILEPILGAADGPGKLGDDNDVVELVALARKADALVRERDARADDIARTSDAIKENYFLRAQIEDAQRARAIDNRAQLDNIREQNEALRRRLEELLRG